MINRTILVGRLTKEPELRRTQTGTSVVQFALAVERRFKQEGQPDTDFINCVAWNKTADLMAQYLHKGSLVGVEGRIQTRSYNDKSGKKTYTTEVVVEYISFLTPRDNTVSQNQQTNTNTYQEQNNASQGFYEDEDINMMSDDLPF